MDSNKMNGLVLHAIDDMRYEQVDKTVPKVGEVLLKVKASGICSSDIFRVFKDGAYHFPIILGHEFAGIIEGVGDVADNDLIGKKAVVFPMLPCKQCQACLNEQYAQCANYNYFGSRCDGGFAEYIVVPKWNIVCFDNLDYSTAALCEPASVSLHAIKIADVKENNAVAIIGSGTIAFLIAAFCKMKGVTQIVICARSDNKIAYARKLGYSAVKTDGKLEESLKEVLNGKLPDVVFECVGNSQTLENSVQACAPFGVVVTVGNPNADMTLTRKTYWKILRQQLQIRGTWNSGFAANDNDWKEALALMSKDSTIFEKLITHKFSFKDHEKAFKTALDHSEFILKIMFVNN